MTDPMSDRLRFDDPLFRPSQFLCDVQLAHDTSHTLVVNYASPGLAEAVHLRRSASAVGRWGRFELLQLIHPDERDAVVAALTDAAAKRTSCRFQCRLVPSAPNRRFDVLIEPGGPDEPGRWRAAITDISEWHEVEARLQAHHTRIMLATEAAQIGVWEADFATGTSLYDEQMYDIYGLDKPVRPRRTVPEPLPGFSMQEWLQTVHPDDVPTCLEALDRADRTLQPVEYEHRIIRPSGEVRNVRSTALIIADDQGRRIRGVGTTVDVTDRKRLTRELSQEKERLELALRAGRIGIWEVDLASNEVTSWDRQLRVLYGMDLDDEEMPSVDDIMGAVHPDDSAMLTEEWGKAMASGALDKEFRVVRPSGETVYVRSLAQVFYAPDGSPARIVGVNWDSTAERTLTEALRAEKERAEAAERVKSDFLAVMSHEIRTPLNTVIGMTQLSLQTELTPKQRGYLSKIDVAARTLLNILNDILDFSKIEAGRMQLEETAFTIESVLESVAAVTTMVAEEKGLEIAFAVSPGVPNRLVGDPLRLGQVLINLVSNAIKFTERGEVVVAIDLEQPAVDDRVVLRCEVRDTGIGLSADQIPHLFQAFSQAEQSVSRRYGGTGLGLAICRRLVELMGGRIWATGQPGQGSTFTFTFTAGIPQDTRTQTRGSSTGLAGRRVLIVDDNASARQILRVMVQTLSLHAQDVSSGPAALRALKEAAWRGEPFDLVLMDWRMPGMDGLEAAERIKTDTDLSNVPAILMVTAYGREEILKRAQQLGLNGVLIKPVTESMMFNAIADALSHAYAGSVGVRPDDGQPRAPEGPASNERWRPLAGRRVLVVDDNALNREVVMEWLHAVGIDVETAVDGHQALARLDEQRYDAVLMDVHMPGMDGLTATREIRRRPAIKDLPVIALTAQAQPSDREASLEAGMNAHLTKPIDSERLYSTLIEWIAPGEAVRAPRATPSSAGARGPAVMTSNLLPASLPGIDLAAALEQLGGREALLQRLMRSFAADFRDGPVSLDAHLQHGRIDEVARLAHTVKSAAAYLGATALSEAAAALETTARYGTDDELPERVQAFRDHLVSVLASLDDLFARDAATTQPGTGHAGASFDPSAVLALVESAEPLVARGDYGVADTLDQLGRLLAGTPDAPLVESVRTHFEELELDAAVAELRRLGDALRHNVRP